MASAKNEILTADEAAALLRISPSTVHKLARLGKIPAQKVGPHYRFHRTTLIHWIAGKKYVHEKKSNSPLLFRNQSRDNFE